MSSLSYTTKLIGAFLSRFKGVIFGAVILGVALFLSFRFLAPIIFSPTLRIGYVGAYTPDNMPEEVSSLISEGLTVTGSDGETLPGLAKNWESQDGKKWTFTLDDQKTWQDGKKITSADINYSFTDVAVSKPDSKTLVFELNLPLSPFPSVLSKPVFKKGLLGVGPWKVAKLTLSGNNVERLVLKNEDGSRRIIKFYPTEDRAKLGFKLGEVNELVDLFNPGEFTTWETVTVKEEVYQDRVVVLFFNVTDDFLADKSIRQGLAYAIDKEKLGGQLALSPLSPDSWAFNPQVKPYKYDKQRADELIERLGEIKLVTTPALLSVAESIAQDWGSVGVDTKVQITSIFPSEYQAFLVIYDIPKDPDQYSTWHSSQKGTNISKYASPRIDKLLEDGRLEVDKEKRREIYLDFQRFLLEDAPAVFLQHPSSYSIIRK
jgi:peptide/nickel transport system substrate-binding protein